MKQRIDPLWATGAILFLVLSVLRHTIGLPEIPDEFLSGFACGLAITGCLRTIIRRTRGQKAV